MKKLCGFLILGLIACNNFSTSNETLLNPPTVEEIKLSIDAANFAGLVPNKSFTPLALPTCSDDVEAEITYSMENLPDWMNFDAETRTLSVIDDIPPEEAYEVIELTFRCEDTDNADIFEEVTFKLNDADNGGLSDGYEFLNRQAPLLNHTIGQVQLSAEAPELYESNPGIFVGLSNYMTMAISGFDRDDPTDDIADFDNDGVRNIYEIEDGTNPYVATSSATFTEADRLTAGNFAFFIAAGDFNGDGFLDLAVSSAGEAEVSVFISNGDGSFADAVTLASPFVMVGIMSADLDSDGLLDIAHVAGNGGGGVDEGLIVHLNQGDDTFATADNFGDNVAPVWILGGDFNADGSMDLAATNYRDGDIAVFDGNGDGTFSNQTSYGSLLTPAGMTSADFNRDSFIDFLVPEYNDAAGTRLVAYLGTEEGLAQDELEISSGTGPIVASAGDFNSDHATDFVACNFGEANLSVYLNNGDGTFADRVSYNTTTSCVQAVPGDLDGDGDLDLAVSNFDNGIIAGDNINIFLNDGSGTFEGAPVLSTGGSGYGLTLFDMDNDGDLDLAATDVTSSELIVFENQ